MTHKLPQLYLQVQGKIIKLITNDGNLTTPTGLALGYTEVDFGTITVNASSTISAHALKDTVLHECIHVLDHGIQIGLKEKQVHRLASALLELMWSNPALAAWLCQRDYIVKGPSKSNKKASTKKKRAPRKPKHPPMGFINISGMNVGTTPMALPSIPVEPYPPNHRDT